MAMSNAVLSDSLKYYLTTDSVATRPTAWTLSLHTGDPGTAGTANEVTDVPYARQSITFGVTGETAANTNALTYPAAAVAYVVTHVVVWGDGSNPKIIQALRTPKSIGIGAQATLAIGELTAGGTV